MRRTAAGGPGAGARKPPAPKPPPAPTFCSPAPPRRSCCAATPKARRPWAPSASWIPAWTGAAVAAAPCRCERAPASLRPLASSAAGATEAYHPPLRAPPTLPAGTSSRRRPRRRRAAGAGAAAPAARHSLGRCTLTGTWRRGTPPLRSPTCGPLLLLGPGLALFHTQMPWPHRASAPPHRHPPSSRRPTPAALPTFTPPCTPASCPATLRAPPAGRPTPRPAAPPRLPACRPPASPWQTAALARVRAPTALGATSPQPQGRPGGSGSTTCWPATCAWRTRATSGASACTCRRQPRWVGSVPQGAHALVSRMHATSAGWPAGNHRL